MTSFLSVDVYTCAGLEKSMKKKPASSSHYLFSLLPKIGNIHTIHALKSKKIENCRCSGEILSCSHTILISSTVISLCFSLNKGPYNYTFEVLWIARQGLNWLNLQDGRKKATKNPLLVGGHENSVTQRPRAGEPVV